MRVLHVLPFLAVTASSLAGQATAPRGVPKPDRIVARALRDTALASILSSVKILRDTTLGSLDRTVRVLTSWGPSAGLDCDCLLSNLYIATNSGGEELHLVRVQPLLDPAIDSLTSVGSAIMIYVSYGLPAARQRTRIEVRGTRVHARAVQTDP